MNRKMSLSIRRKLILTFAIVLLLPSLIIGGVTYWTASHRIEAALMHSAEESVSTVDSILTQNIGARVADLDYYANALNTKGIDKEVAEGGGPVGERFKEYLAIHKDVLNLYVGTESGATLLGIDQELPADFDPRTRGWYALATNSSAAVISPVYMSVDGSPVVSISKLMEDGQGVIALDLDLTGLSETISMKVGEEGYILLLDDAKQVLVHPGGSVGQVSQEGFVTSMFAENQGITDYMVDEQKYKMAFYKNELTGWRIGGTMNEGEVTKETSAIRDTAALVLLLSLLGGAVLTFFNIRSIVSPLHRLKKATAVLGQGDLTEELNGFKQDEIGELARNFQVMVDSLRQMITGVREMTDNVSASSEQLSAGTEQTTKAIEHVTVAIQDVAAGSEQQLQSVESGAGSVDTMSQQLDYISGNVNLITRVMSGTATSAKQGIQLVETTEQRIRSIDVTVDELAEVVNSLNIRAAEIGDIAVLMAGIAQQTNLLALNASIEAARAGEQGRGFAVVAGEVRKLAEGSAHSADQIRELIGQIGDEMKRTVATMVDVKGKVTEGIEAVSLSGESFGTISKSVVEAADVMQHAADAMQQVAGEAGTTREAMEQIRHLSEEAAGNTQTISAAAQEQLASLEEMASSSADLSLMAEQLQELVSRFKIYKGDR